MKETNRKLKLSWDELCKTLQRQGGEKALLPDEEIKEITLVKPRGLLIYAGHKVKGVV